MQSESYENQHNSHRCRKSEIKVESTRSIQQVRQRPGKGEKELTSKVKDSSSELGKRETVQRRWMRDA